MTPVRPAVLFLGCLLIVSVVSADQPRPARYIGPPQIVEPLPETPPDMATLVESPSNDWISTGRPIGAFEDLTAATGVAVTGGLTYWGTPLSDRTVQHVAGRTPGGDLHVFWWTAAGAPQVVNVSAKTSVRIASDPVAWLGVAPNENIAAITTAGAVQVFNWTPAADWVSFPISTTSGRTFAGNVVVWTTPGTPPVEHVAAITTGGEIFVFYRRGNVPFSRVDVTAKTGIRAKGLGGAWVSTGSEHLVVTGTDNKLYELTWSSTRDWTPTAIPLPHDVTGDVAAHGNSWFSQIAVRSNQDALFVLTRSPTGRPWITQEITQFDGEKVTGRPALSLMGNGAQVAVRGVDGELLVFWIMPNNPIWQVLSISDLAGIIAAGTPALWTAAGTPEAVAAAGPDSRLRVLRNYGEAQRLTERLLGPFNDLRAQTGVRKTVTILWNPETTAANCAANTGPAPGCMQPCNPATIGDGTKMKFLKSAADDAMRTVDMWFRENSGNLMTVQNVATLGWYTSVKPGGHYWQAHGGSGCLDGWDTGDREKWAEAIKLADRDFNFAPFDLDGDKTLRPNELAVVIMIPNPFSSPPGFYGPVWMQNGAPLIVDGVKIEDVTEIYVYSVPKAGSEFTDGTPLPGLSVHEISHHLLRHADMYIRPTPPTGPGPHAIMDVHNSPTHHDGWSKMKFQWVRPRIIWHSGRYTIKDVETRRSVRVLLHPSRGTGEYLVFENRFRGSTFDKDLAADGLAIYHVVEDPGLSSRSLPPFYWTSAEWAKWPDWDRRALRMIRPVSNSGRVLDGGSAVPYNNSFSVWRAGDASTSYDLLPFPAARERAWLRWSDGSNPGRVVRDVSAAGAEMRFTVGTVSLANPALCAAAGNKNCGWIPDGFGGQAFCGDCTGFNRCGGGGIPNVCGCIPRTCDDNFCGTVSDGCGGKLECDRNCPEGYFCNRFQRCQPIPEPCPCGGQPPDNCLPCPQEPLAKPPS